MPATMLLRPQRLRVSAMSAPPLPQVYDNQHEQHSPDHSPHTGVVDVCDERHPEHDPDGHRGEEAQQRRPVGVLTVDAHGDHITDEQERQQRAGGLPCGQDRGEQRDADRGDAADGCLGEADAHRGGHEREDLDGSEVACQTESSASR